ncbi:MAG: isoleucine--tRNA ligase [Dehalococcoidia bacterium]|nr:isoleucine--tRNA ligase [Dehalococcoidia bacterium]
MSKKPSPEQPEDDRDDALDADAATPAGVAARGPFAPVSSKVSFPKQEERILALWKEAGVFRKSVEQRRGGPQFTLFEGPPTANGSPGIHHVLSRVFKDIMPRFKTMQGFHAPRRAGWDTHGLPVELEVEKELLLKSKPDIEAYGVEKFNERCRASVFRYVKDWERMTDRVAYWTDLQDAYVTYDNRYIETAWWIVKQLWDIGLVYEGRRVAPHCPRCGTTLSSHEVALGYAEDTPDPSVYIKFQVDATTAPAALQAHINPTTYLLAWTTTPWTLPGNSGLSVSAKDAYALVRLTKSGEQLILAHARVKDAVREEHTVLAQVDGAALEGMRYRPLYNPFDYGVDVLQFTTPGVASLNPVPAPPSLTYPVITAGFVTMDDGTGIVHTSPPFGQDDYEAGVAHGLMFVQPVKLDGTFLGSYKWAGKFVKNADDAIAADLKERGLLYRRETIKHTYPFCWRCSTPLLYYAKSSWYLRTTAVKDRLLEANEAIAWYPEHIKSGRFGEWLKGNIDWAVSRERYWGTPWPVWQCRDCHHQEVIGSRDDLAGKRGVKNYAPELDLHRPYVDAVTFDCAACGGTMQRVPEVMDAWFDSGIMPLAQWHYPFEHRDLIEGGAWYPADFICEAIDQTRGWFYSLHAVAALLEKATDGKIAAPSYKNVICLGHILDSKGEKMSKSRGNVVNPWDVINAHGADAIRWYLYAASPPGNSRRFSTQLVAEAVRTFILPLWNTYSFFVTYANLDGWRPGAAPAAPPAAELDRWVLSRLHTLIAGVTLSLETYDPNAASRKIEAFVEDLSNWYVRRSRRRFWKGENDADKLAAYATLYECLTTLAGLLAPFTPFLAEEIYQNLVRSVQPSAPESVHLTDYPKTDLAKIDAALIREVDLTIRAVSLGRAARSKAKLRVRQPLQALVIAPRAAADRDALERHVAHLREELNIKEVRFVAGEEALVAYQVKGNPAKLGPKHGPQMGKVMGAIAKADAAALARQARAGATITLDGFTLAPDDLAVGTVDKPGYATAADPALTVAVTTDVTPELAAEGTARELVHRIQTMRRAAGFAISDRIAVTFQTQDETLARVFALHGDAIRTETLADRIERAAPPGDAYREEVRLDDVAVLLGVGRVG